LRATSYDGSIRPESHFEKVARFASQGRDVFGRFASIPILLEQLYTMPVATSDVSAALTYDGYSEQVMHAIEAKVAIRLPNWVLPP